MKKKTWKISTEIQWPSFNETHHGSHMLIPQMFEKYFERRNSVQRSCSFWKNNREMFTNISLFIWNTNKQNQEETKVRGKKKLKINEMRLKSPTSVSLCNMRYLLCMIPVRFAIFHSTFTLGGSDECLLREVLFATGYWSVGITLNCVFTGQPDLRMNTGDQWS